MAAVRAGPAVVLRRSGSGGLRAEALLVLAAFSAALVGQGAYYHRDQLFVGLLILAAGAILVVRAGLRSLPIPRLALAGVGTAMVCALVAGTADGDLRGGLGVVALLLGLTIVALVAAASSQDARRQFVDVLIVLGCLLAVSGWVGVAFRLSPLGHPDGGLWRAATTVTYANASAAILAPLALWALARATAEPAAAPAHAATMLLLVGLGATASRAGFVGFLAGVVFLAVRVGPGRLARAAVPAVSGALVAMAPLARGMSVTHSAGWAWDAMGLVAGVVIALSGWSRVWPRVSRRVALAGGASALAAAVVVVVIVIGPAGWSARFGLSSPDRHSLTTAAVQVWSHHPVTGVGPGRAVFEWTTADRRLLFDRYAHDEYLQTAVEEGALGLLALLAIGVAIVTTVATRATRPARANAMHAGAVAGLVCLAVHSGFDFLWHVPAVLLVAAAAVGLAADLPRLPKRKEPQCAEHGG